MPSLAEVTRRHNQCYCIGMDFSLRHLVPSVSVLLACLSGCPSANSLDVGSALPDAGRDASGVDAPGVDAWSATAEDAFALDAPPLDAFYMATCAPMQAETNLCFAGECLGVTGAFWNGSECVESRCDCIGPECGIYATKAACDAAHTTCQAALCTSTGGAWFRVPAWCGDFVCGRPNQSPCDTPTTACDCGVRGRFVDGVGCMTDTKCPISELIDPQQLCGITGGEWQLGICGHATCGRLSGLDCASPGCVCGVNETFDLGRGCIPNPLCEVRVLGESCTETQLCGDGTTCCANGGASTEASCVAPMCSTPDEICGPARP